MAWFETGSSEHFALHILPLFSGPQVNIRVGKGNEYSVSKSLLCAESSYFKAMFEKGFSEKEATSVTLEPIDGVVSEESLVALLQWLYTHRVEIDVSDEIFHVSAIIELARLANMYGITGMEATLAEDLRVFMDGGVDSDDEESRYTGYLVTSHIESASELPNGHPVRSLLTRAAADEFLETSSPVLVKATPELAAEILEYIRFSLDGIQIVNKRPCVTSLVFPDYRIRICSHSFDVDQLRPVW